MNKKDIQKRVLKFGEPLALNDFTWCNASNTFSSQVDHLVIDFSDLNGVTIKVGYCCTVQARDNCTIIAVSGCSINSWHNSNITVSEHCFIATGYNSKIKAKDYCQIVCSEESCIDVNSNCDINAGPSSNVKTGDNCVISVPAESHITTGNHCVIVNKNRFQVIEPRAGDHIQICPYGISGHLVNGE